MPDPEIKIKVTLDSPKDPWAEYKQKVKEAEAATRSLFAGTFKDTQERDAAIDSLGDKLDNLVSEGFELEKVFKSIGFTPEQKNDFDTIVSMIESANRQFQIALDNRERLMQPIEEPDQPFVTGFGWEDGPETTKFREQFAAMSSSLSEYKTQIADAIAANVQMKATLEAEYAALDASSAGYAERKKLLEQLLSASDSFAVSSESQRQTIEKQSEALSKLNEETENTGRFEENLKSLEQLSDKVVTSGLKVQKSLRTQQGIAERYSTEMAELQQKELQQQQKKQAELEKELQKQQHLHSILEIQGKTYEELVQLFNELTAARAKVNTKEELTAIDAKLTAVRRNIELTSREAQLSGARIIGSQTSIQGVFSSTLRLWQRGTLTLKGLTQGMAMFAKSTVFLAAIQLAWELLTNVWEKAKEALFGTADAAEKAAEQQRELAAAAKEASVNLLAAQDALYEARREAERKAAAEEFKSQLKAQNDEYERQIKLVDEATAAQLRQMANTAKDDERQLALDKLLLQQELMSGKITEYEHQERLIRLENEAQQKKLEAATKQKKIALDAAAGQEQAAKRNKELAEKVSMKDMAGFEMSEVQVAELVTEYNERKRKVDELTPKYAHLPKKREKLQRFVDKFKDHKDHRVQRMVKEKEEDLVDVERRIKELDDERNAMNEVFNLIPELVRKIGLNEFGVRVYSNEKSGRESYNASVQAEIDKTTKTLEKAEKATQKAEKAYQEAAEDNADAAIHAAKVSQMRIDMNRFNEQEAAKNAENAKRIQAARDKVNGMEYKALKDEEKRLLDEVTAAGDKTPEGKRLAELAGVYTAERRSRDVEARKARERVTYGGRDATGAQAQVIRLAGKVTEQAVRTGEVDFKAAADVLDKAFATKGKADNAAAMEMYRVLQNLITTVQAETAEVKLLERNYKRLAAKAAKN